MDNPRDFASKVKELIEQNQTSARFIVNMGCDGIHFAAFDYSLRNGKPSVVDVEPATTLLNLTSVKYVKVASEQRDT